MCIKTNNILLIIFIFRYHIIYYISLISKSIIWTWMEYKIHMEHSLLIHQQNWYSELMYPIYPKLVLSPCIFVWCWKYPIKSCYILGIEEICELYSACNMYKKLWALCSASFCPFVNRSLYDTYALHTNAICQKFKPEIYWLPTVWLSLVIERIITLKILKLSKS